jgi:hypothetical protein
MPSKNWSDAFWSATTPALAAALAVAPARDTAAAAEHGAQDAPLEAAALEQQRVVVAAGATAGTAAAAATGAGSVDPAVVVRLIWASGNMDRVVPAEPAGLLLQAAQQALPQCGFEALTAMGLGLVRMRRAALAAAPTGDQCAPAPGAKQQQQQHCTSWSALAGQQAALWEAWFARSSQLLQLDPKVAAQMRLQQQQPGHTGCQPVNESASSVQQQQQQQRGCICSADISLQLFIPAHLRLTPPDAWSRAMLAATAAQLQSMNLEQLSWVVWSVTRLGLATQLPPGWLCAMLVRIGSVRSKPGSSSNISSASMLRLGKALRRLQAAQCVQQQEWQLWLLLAEQWRASQGIVQ